MGKSMDITKELEIKNINGLRFGNQKTCCKTKGYAFYHKRLGYLAFKEDNKESDIKVPYIPLGGKSALQSILESGGFTDYNNIEWLHPINY